jgi:hypothetical protein
MLKGRFGRESKRKLGAVMAAIVVILSPSKAACEYKAF